MSTPAYEKSDFVPAWMLDLGVKPKEWLNMTKAQLRSQQRPDKPLKVQVWATGMLHTSGYNTQEATTLRNGKKVPLTPGDIATELFTMAKQYYQVAGVKASEKEFAALKESKEDLRQALKDLEDDGVAMRTDAKGTPLRELSADQLRRLPSGRTRMLFWAIPRQPDPIDVASEWQQRLPPEPPESAPDDPDLPSAVYGEVGKISLPLPPIWQILKGLKIGDSETAQIKAKIANPAYQKTVERAWLAARKIFIEVVTESLPDEVGPESPREVGTTGGAFETKDELYKVERGASASSPGSSSSSKEPATTTPASDLEERDFHTRLCACFQDAGKNVPVRKQSAPVYAKVETHAEHFLGWLTPKKLARVKHPGALPDLVEEFLLMIAALPSPPPSEEEKQRQEAEEVMRNPDGFDKQSREWARNFLGMQAKGAGS